jgi:hypothetical protein
MENLNLPIYLVGDIHSAYDTLFRKIEHLDLKDCYLLHVGDGGEGFLPQHKQVRQFEHYNNRFKKRNILFKSIRGNHSDPSYFLGQYTLSHFELLPDYTIRNYNGEKFLFVGGAVSIDRRLRVPHMSWWENEEFDLRPELIEKCDVLITHSAPSWNGECSKQGLENWCLQDPKLWDDCLKERKNHDKLIDLCKPEKHYCGHMHTSSTTYYNGCLSKILNILEIVEHH